MSKLQLKAALDSLQVKKPLRLPAKAPTFAAPAPVQFQTTPVANQTQVEIPTVAENPTQVGTPPPAENTTLVANSTVVKTPTEVVHVTEVSTSTQVTNPTEVSNPTGVQSTTPVVKAEVSKPTPVSQETEVAIPAPVESQTPVQNSTRVDELSQAGNPTVVIDQTSVMNVTQVEDRTPAQSPTPVTKQTEGQDSKGTEDRAAATRRATEQDSSVALEARAVDSLEKGYTRLPNAVLMKLASTDFTRNEIKLALLIARFTISFQRKHAPLSKTVLERRTGLRGPAVLEALSGLVSKGLVEKIQGDQHRPNLLGLVLPPDWDQPTKPNRDTSDTSATNPTQVEKTSVGKPTSTGAANPTGAGVGKPINFKDSERYLKETLSQLPDALRSYFEGLRLQRKRESEWQAFEELRAEFSADDIADAYAQIADKPIPGGQTCHSPMAYLAVAMNDIMQTVSAKRAREKKWEAALAQAEEEGRRIAENEENEKREFALRDRAFARFVGSRDESEVIAEICRKHNFPIETGNIGRGFAVANWWNALSSDEKHNAEAEVQA